MRSNKKSIVSFDVSGYDDDDFAESKRRSGKSKSRATINKQKTEAEALLKEKNKKIKEEKSKGISKKVKETVEAKTKKTKRKRKTVGELIELDKKRGTKKAEKRLSVIRSKIPTVNPEPSVYLVTENTTERHYQEEYNKIFVTLGSLCRKLETNMEHPDKNISSRDVYALMTMYSQMRETIADLRSISDVNVQSEKLILEVFQPYHRTVGETMVSMLYKLMTHLRQNLDEAAAHRIGERLQEIMSEEAINLQEQFESARDKIVAVLNASK